jgi:hypothetical protein
VKFIDENIVNQVLEMCEDDKAYLDAFQDMLTTQPDLNSYLAVENYSLLSAEELSLLEYLTCMIYASTKKALDKTPVIMGPSLEKYEEQNWDVFNEAGKKSFSKVLDLFFDQYPQEDLLALVEDAVSMDDETPVTIVGAEIIVVTCKSIIDTLHHHN